MGLTLRGVRFASRVPRTSLWTSQYRSASRATYTVPIAKPRSEDKHWHISTLDECPSPTCQCRETPEGLDIDRESKLNGTMPAYALQVVVSTGRTDWKSRIQEDEDSALVNQLAKFTGPKGKFSDVRPLSNTCIMPNLSLTRLLVAISQCIRHQLINPAHSFSRRRTIDTSCTKAKYSPCCQTRF
jgi:hypothetical protein